MAWIMTSFGILMPAIRPPKTVDPGDERTLQIRTRREHELTILRAQYMPRTLGPTLHTPTFDYEYRAYCTPEAFAFAMARLITEIDYTKFKPTVKERYYDLELYDTYNSIWGVVSRHLSVWEYPVGRWSGAHDDWHRDATVIDLDRYTGEHTAPDLPLFDDTRQSTDPRAQLADTLYTEVDRLTSELDAVIDHSVCEHAATANARRRCTRRVRAERAARIDDLYAEIDMLFAATDAITAT